MFRKKLILVTQLTVAAMLFAAAADARAAIDAFLLSGVGAPDGNGTFITARLPALNDEGQLAFIAQLTGTTGGSISSDRTGLFRREVDGMITQVARGGQPAPGGGTFSTSFGEAPLLNNAGDVAFASSGSSAGIFRASPLSAIARIGQASPDGNGTFNNLRLGGLNDSGQVSYYAFLNDATPSSTDQGIYRSDGATTATIARRGATVPGASATFASFGQLTKVNESGEVAFYASTAPGSLSGAYRGDGVTTTLLAQVGGLAPGVDVENDGIFGTIGAPTSINDHGAAAFTAKIEAASHGGHGGLFRSDGVDAALIFLQGQPAPDASGGTSGVFATWERALVNNAGEVIAWARLNDTPGGSSDNLGLFVGDGTTIRQVVRNGDPAPDGNGVIQIFNRNSIINHAGQTAFYASHNNAEPGTTDGIYLYDPTAGLLTVARAGQSLLGSTISSLRLAGDILDTPINDMETSGLNELGQVAFQFRLATGAEGLAIWSPPSADFNDDGDVDSADLALWQAGFATGTTILQGDADGDSDADGADFLTWQRQLGAAATPTAASRGAHVPEPRSLLLVLLALAANRVNSRAI